MSALIPIPTQHNTPAESTALMAMSLSVSKRTYAHLFSKSEWNAMVRFALLTAGQFWIANYLPLRFTEYARAKNIYTGNKPRGFPLVRSGHLRQHTLAHGRADAKATTNKVYLDLIIPTAPVILPKREGTGGQWMNYSSNRVVQQSLYAARTITAFEMKRMNDVFSETLQAMLDGVQFRSYRSGRKKYEVKRARLSPMQRASIGLAPRKAASRPERARK